ncbi:MAG TPA: malto-oligosyltrehalose trehalohydrolase [Acidobacteriaceae bacterium]|jgi:malto-oligosyltrehalose trehalohydrolase|nr:malto-oligosyltrehalose trehalohydrolase [Acidobacteriaceae bacterium]
MHVEAQTGAETLTHADRMRFGAELTPEGGARLRLFAPAAAALKVALDEHKPGSTEPLAMEARGDGWFEALVADARPGTRYRFVLPDGSRVPDPASRFQPLGVHGPSEIVDPEAFQWTDGGWKGRPWEEAVLYELHVGTFTQEGTFAAAAGRLEHLTGLGVTGIELMCPVAFAGQRSWGYDGVMLYAPDSTYGRPEDLKSFIDRAHGLGMMVILDVVYNHFGPEGNYLPKYFPEIFSAEHKTAWGPGLNFDGPGSAEVRQFILQNALYWIEEFRVDGLRLDASHALIDGSPRHILDELAERVRACAGERTVHLILENEQTIGRLLTRRPDGSEIAYTAQWNHASDHLLGEAMRPVCDPADANQRHDTDELGKALAQGFVAGELNCPDPEDEIQVPPTAYVSFIQTHDLVGNRVFGERIHALAPGEAVRAIAAIYLLLPQCPMLFMGEEWAATTPFPFFSDFGGELGEAVRKGRREQMERTGQLKAGELDGAPDPQAESTFRSAKLHWEELEDPAHAAQVRWYGTILALRRERLVPLLRGLVGSCGTHEVLGPGRLKAEWQLSNGAQLSLAANLCGETSGGFGAARGTPLWVEGTEAEDGRLGPWTVRWCVEEPGG